MSERGAFSYSGKLAFVLAACRDPNLIRSDLAALAVLVDHIGEHHQFTFVSVPTIVDESSVPRTTAVRAIRRLERTGWIKTERRHGACTRYYLTRPAGGTSSADGTRTTWVTSGSIQGLRTGPGGGTKDGPPADHEHRNIQQGGEQGPPAPPVDCNEVIEAWNELCPMLRSVQGITEDRMNKISEVAKLTDGMEEISGWRALFIAVAESQFLTGNCPPRDGFAEPFQATFDWLLKPDNALKVIEGNFDGTETKGNGPRGPILNHGDKWDKVLAENEKRFRGTS